MARPKLDPAVTQRIVDLIRAGNYLEVAATAAGIHKSTLHRWLRCGREQIRGRYRKFLVHVEKAQAESESRDVALIAKAASTDWRAAAWRLEKKLPRRYGPRVQISVQQELDAVLDRLKAGLPPDQFERVLEIIAAADEALPGTDANGNTPLLLEEGEVAVRRLAGIAEVARRRLQREREPALHDPAHADHLAALRAAGYLVVEVPGCQIVIKRYLSAGEE